MPNLRIGFVTPHILTNIDRELIDGIFSYLSIVNSDLFIITGISNFENSKKENSYVDGIQNIYSLLEYGDFDGIIFNANAFINSEIKSDIYQTILKRKIPCIVLEEKNDIFTYIYPEQHDMIKELTKHLIEEHNCKKIYFLSGFPNDILLMNG